MIRSTVLAPALLLAMTASAFAQGSTINATGSPLAAPVPSGTITLGIAAASTANDRAGTSSVQGSTPSTTLAANDAAGAPGHLRASTR